MKSFGIASAAAAVLGGAALFATSVNADVDPIVIKVRATLLDLLHRQC